MPERNADVYEYFPYFYPDIVNTMLSIDNYMLDGKHSISYDKIMNRLSLEQRAHLIGLLVVGNSLRATSRLAGVSFNTVLKFLADMGCAASAYQDVHLVNLPCKRLQVDEIWSFYYAKKKNVESAKSAPIDAGDVWTWTAICADTKLVPSFRVGSRDGETGNAFMDDLAGRLSSRVQLTSDGHHSYLDAVAGAFGNDIDFAQLIKHYGGPVSGKQRYSPPVCVGCTGRVVSGSPDAKHISTSLVERQNLTMRMSMRRFTHLTNGFSKKVENHTHAVALHFMYYNFGRLHKSLKGQTPAMAAGIADHVWTLAEIATIDDIGREPVKRGPSSAFRNPTPCIMQPPPRVSIENL